MKRLMLLMVVLQSYALAAQPPEPANGYRWVLQEQFSDEFDGSELNLDKWYNYHPYWKGRPPAMFHTDMVSVAEGMLQIKNQKLEKDSVVYNSWNDTYTTFSIAGGAVVSRTLEAHYGYYECRMKANKTLMSSTFWMSNRGSEGPKGCGDSYSEELDIQECVGRASSATNSFHKGMHSNTHYWYTDCEGEKETYSLGSEEDVETDVTEDFHVYAAHWHDAKEVTFYFDDQPGRNVKFRNDVTDNPFDRPMQINMVTETYDWVGVPTDEELADNSKNVTYYDWIRSYELVANTQGTNVEMMTPVYEEDLSLMALDYDFDEGDDISVRLNYKLNSNGNMQVDLLGADDAVLSSVKQDLYFGFGQDRFDLALIGASEQNSHAKRLRFRLYDIENSLVDEQIVDLDEVTLAVEGPKLNMEIYPNPGQDQMWVKSPELLEVKLVSMQGSIVREGVVSINDPMDISFLPRGVYVLYISGYKAKRFVKS
ncbi:family 16 glycosylhydrolase [Reichenbachiella agariperforans]|uniref:family 16 glycosylhydrolase n=1 Tax=Reichenbachiella agariperforans TaxID=156994 RepID=UPI001C09075B|nr:family 16 glycosylhydrolase [Reichenbachiella agariperforans]MBU2912587.1 family 16 glycosylhydrolase [Reichenbachiella agariperforans]